MSHHQQDLRALTHEVVIYRDFGGTFIVWCISPDMDNQAHKRHLGHEQL